MRRSISSLEKDKDKTKKNQRILGIVLIVVMFGSVFGVIVGSFNSDKEEQLKYKNYDLIKNNGIYELRVGQSSFYFSKNPNELSRNYDVNVTKLITNYVSTTLYVDTNDYYAAQEIQNNLEPYVVRIQPACISEDSCPSNELPIKTCDENVIIIRESEENKIYEDNKCVFIEGKSENLSELVDIFILKILGLN